MDTAFMLRIILIRLALILIAIAYFAPAQIEKNANIVLRNSEGNSQSDGRQYDAVLQKKSARPVDTERASS